MKNMQTIISWAECRFLSNTWNRIYWTVSNDAVQLFFSVYVCMCVCFFFIFYLFLLKFPWLIYLWCLACVHCVHTNPYSCSYWWAMFNILERACLCCVLCAELLTMKIMIHFHSIYNYFWLVLGRIIVVGHFIRTCWLGLYEWLCVMPGWWLKVVSNPTQFKIKSKTKTERREDEEERKEHNTHHPTKCIRWIKHAVVIVQGPATKTIHKRARLTCFQYVCVWVCAVFLSFSHIHITRAPNNEIEWNAMRNNNSKTMRG